MCHDAATAGGIDGDDGREAERASDRAAPGGVRNGRHRRRRACPEYRPGRCSGFEPAGPAALGTYARTVGPGGLHRRLRARDGRVRARLGAHARRRRDLRSGGGDGLRVLRREPRCVRGLRALANRRARRDRAAALRQRALRGDRPRDRGGGPEDRVPAASLAGVSVQPVELRARAHARSLRRLRVRVSGHAARYDPLRVSGLAGGRRRRSQRGRADSSRVDLQGRGPGRRRDRHGDHHAHGAPCAARGDGRRSGERRESRPQAEEERRPLLRETCRSRGCAHRRAHLAPARSLQFRGSDPFPETS